jgi:hypothetical protein
MARKLHAITVFFLFLLIYPVSVNAGAWVQKKGEVFLSLQAYYYQTDHVFNSGGNSKKRDGTFWKKEINSYFEYGLTNRDTLVANIFYDWLYDGQPSPSEKNQGLADIEAGWRRLLFKENDYLVSFQALSVIPSGYDLEDVPQLGYDRFGLEGRILYGANYKFMKKSGFFDISFGYRKYFGYPSDQLRSTAYIGYGIISPFQILGSYDFHFGLDNGSEKQIDTNILIQPNYSLLKLTLALKYKINPRYSIVASAYKHAWGQDTGAGGGFYASFWFNF